MDAQVEGRGDERSDNDLQHLTTTTCHTEQEEDTFLEEEEPDNTTAFPSKGANDKQSWLYKLQRRVPHLYFVTTHLLLPLFTLIGMAFLFGGFLAKIEMKGEIRHNDEVAANILLKYVEHIMERQAIYYGMANTSVQCLADTMGNDALMEAFPDDSIIWTTEDISDCAMERAREMFPATSVLPFLLQSEAPLSFHWMKCWKENSIGDENATLAFLEHFHLNKELSRDQQTARYLHRFYTDWNRLKNETGIPDERLYANKQLVLDVVNQATGSGGCQVHIAGGAVFWFTIMTTIGYGNTAPTSNEGRLLVCTAGFLTIIFFIALNNTAAQVWKAMFEHWFLKFNLPFLVKGPLSLLFWLCMTYLWMLVVALIATVYMTRRFGYSFPLKDQYWFGFVTITTVGLGDISIQHEEFTAWDMFHVPLIVLVGFNFLGIFAEKGVELYSEYFPQQTRYVEILEERRKGDTKDPTTTSTSEAATSQYSELMGVTTVAAC